MAEIYVPGSGSVGSGYILVPHLVLTARHVVETVLPAYQPPNPSAAEFSEWYSSPPGTACRVRRLDRAGRSVFEAAAPVWWSELHDACLLLTRSNLTSGDERLFTEWSDIVLPEPLDVTAAGFPDVDVVGSRREVRQIVGVLAPLSGAKSGRWTVSVQGRLHEDQGRSTSPWAGMSGAALFAGSVLVGIVNVDPDPRQPGRMELWATPVHFIADDPALVDWLSWDGGSAAWRKATAPPRPSSRVLEDLARRLPPTVPTPRQLPPVVEGFIGREGHFGELNKYLNVSNSRTIVVSAISGMGGVGKTALAVTWAQQVAHLFPDGQLFTDLHGYDPVASPREPLDVLGEFLAALGVAPEDVPATPQAKGGLYRSLTAERRMVVLLDNASSTQQVLPLLPGGRDSVVVITSRSDLDGLSDLGKVQRVRLDTLPPADAATLLRSIIVEHEGKATDSQFLELARLCGFLPLALRVAGEKVRREAGDIGPVIAELSDQKRRLSSLTSRSETDGMGAVFYWSYRDLPPEAARMFRLIGIHCGAEISLEAAAALSGFPAYEIRNELQLLVSASLLEKAGVGRYRIHDLLRLYARERAELEDASQDRKDAITRSLSWYLHGADATDRVLRSGRSRPTLDPLAEGVKVPTFASHSEAMRWCELEGANLIAAVQQARAESLQTLAWKIPISVWGYLTHSRKWAGWVSPYIIACQAAHELGDIQAEAWCLHNLGQVYRELRLYHEAQANYEAALALREQSNDLWGQAHTYTAMGACQQDQGNQREAVRYLERALVIHGDISDLSGRGQTLERLAGAHKELGDLTQADEYYQKALVIWRNIHLALGEGGVLNGLGQLYADQGLHEEAISYYRQGLEAHRMIQYSEGIALILVDLGRSLVHVGRRREGRACWCEASELFERLGDARLTQVEALIEALDLRAPDGEIH